MALKYLLAIRTEVNSELDNGWGLHLCLADDREQLETFLKKYPSESLLVAATDEIISLGKNYQVATIAYVNPKLPDETYAGVNMIVEGFEEIDFDFLEKAYQRYHHIPWTILETERCIVRELCLEDLDALFALYGDGEMDKYTDPLYPYEEEKEFQRAYIQNMYGIYGYGMWLVFEKGTGALIGRAGLEHREIHEEIQLELGYLIGKAFQGQGYATEVCNAILDYAKEQTGFSQINCVVEEGNEASIVLAQKLGFEYRESYLLDQKIMLRFVRFL